MTIVSLDELDEDGAPVSSYPLGSLLPGKLPAWQRLGVGLRCETWLAWSAQLWSPVVVKFPRPHQLDHPRARQALCREVAALGGNLHPALPRLYVDGTNAVVPHIVLEHIDGLALDDDLDERGPLRSDETALVGVRLLSALRSVHARGLVHVDVKPANVMLRDGRAVLLDFGSSRRIGAAQQSGQLIGSPGYAAPDLEAGEPISAAVDMYGVGVTLYEALTGVPAFDPDLAAHERSDPPRLPRSPIASLVEQLMATRPSERPDLVQALQRCAEIADPHGGSARPPARLCNVLRL